MAKLIVPNRQAICNVDDQCPWQWRCQYPLAAVAQDLQARDTTLGKDSEAFEILISNKVISLWVNILY